MACRGLPERVSACRVDLDGGLTDTASGHAAGKQQYDEYLRVEHLRVEDLRARAGGVPGEASFRPDGNAAEVLAATGPAPLPAPRVDGVVARQRDLPGRPAPDPFLAGAADLGAGHEAAAVFEDALSGVSAGRAGKFAFVIGVDRVGNGHGDALRSHGADLVVTDLAQLLDDGGPRFDDDPHP
jgi:beta-phosphoglucomutase-like phosphatase (HAD superfamily)